MPQRTLFSGDCGEASPPRVACCIIYSKTNRFINVRYIMPLFGKVQRCSVSRHDRLKRLFRKKRTPKNKSGRGPPTSPTLRPRVLTPRDHFAHRGGGRGMIMHNSDKMCNRNYGFFSHFCSVNFVAKIESLFVMDTINLSEVKRTQYCAKARSLNHLHDLRFLLSRPRNRLLHH
jgi:hypothetical protein